MSTQNLNTGGLRSSGHKDATEDHATIAKLNNQGEGGDVEKLLQNRVLNNTSVARAALYDHDDFLCVASSTKQFKLEPDDVRKVLDGLLTYSRVNDPTFAHGDGPPPKHLTIGQEGKADVKDGGNDQIVAELNGKVLILARSARFVILVEGVEGARQMSRTVEMTRSSPS